MPAARDRGAGGGAMIAAGCFALILAVLIPVAVFWREIQ